ncbi:glycosyltransferase family 2 protein [Synechococcus sp. PCC 7336]|uniref:glycosyltransferase family 2 protein n=1 Tax=Synechococcus sp. PCC 7336 TaxID=195250 RepID=UPI000476A207|nr:glycosyltransferase family 2 protein [Synechococcus sp. PCC 7336]
MFFSVVIPTYNRLPILRKCLQAIAQQKPGSYENYEAIVVDDGSTDGTVEWLEQAGLERVKWFVQDHRGPAAARNLGVSRSQGDTIVFIDSDLVVVDDFLAAHAKALEERNRTSRDPSGLSRSFTYGRVINTSNFDDPRSEPVKPTDFSAAFFATGNVAIARHWLDAVTESEDGPFDTRFQLYGWEDLELGVRLKKIGLKLVKCPAAAGYHWNPAFSLDRIPYLIDREWQRGRMGVLFYEKHPTWEVRMMIQMTPLHRILWGLLSLGGWLNERRIRPALEWLVKRGQPGLALELCRICFLNWYNMQGVYEAYREWRERGQLSLPPAP